MAGPVDVESLIAAHAKPAEVDEVNSVLNYAEAPRVGDWTLRSALVRLAQPHPLRSEAVLQLVRRLDAAIKPMVRPLQKHGVVTSRSIPGGAQSIADVRAVDIAADPDMLDAYSARVELDEEERASVHLIQLALRLDELGDTLAAWAHAGPQDPPIETIDNTCAQVLRSMNATGVPEEVPWEGQRGRGRGV